MKDRDTVGIPNKTDDEKAPRNGSECSKKCMYVTSHKVTDWFLSGHVLKSWWMGERSREKDHETEQLRQMEQKTCDRDI